LLQVCEVAIKRIVSYVDVLSSCLNRKRKAAESVSGFGSIETEDVNPLASGNTKVAMIRPESADARNAILGSQNNNLGLKGPAVVSSSEILILHTVLLNETIVVGTVTFSTCHLYYASQEYFLVVFCSSLLTVEMITQFSFCNSCDWLIPEFIGYRGFMLCNDVNPMLPIVPVYVTICNCCIS
jgi:hypothetical protein